jgi:hypothetical protein
MSAGFEINCKTWSWELVQDESTVRRQYMYSILNDGIEWQDVAKQGEQHTQRRRIVTQLHGAKSFLGSLQLLSYSRISQYFKEHKSSLSCLQKSYSGP